MSQRAATLQTSGQTSGGVRPEVFLFPAWRGNGVVCDAFGLPADKYEINGEGRREADGSVVLEHTAIFDSGLKNHFQWKIMPSSGDQIIARDLISGREAKGVVTSRGFRWSFPAEHVTPFGLRRCRLDINYVLVSPTEASSVVTVTFLGVTVGTASCHIRHLKRDEDPAACHEA